MDILLDAALLKPVPPRPTARLPTIPTTPVILTPSPEHPMAKGNNRQKKEVKKPKQDKKNPKPAKK